MKSIAGRCGPNCTQHTENSC